MTARPCGCGCGTPLTPTQRTYASRQCAGRAVGTRMSTPALQAKRTAGVKAYWADPANRAAHIERLRAGKRKEALHRWWADAHLDAAWRRLSHTIALETLDGRDQQRLRAWLTRLMHTQYWRAYRNGYGAGLRRSQPASPATQEVA